MQGISISDDTKCDVLQSKLKRGSTSRPYIWCIKEFAIREAKKIQTKRLGEKICRTITKELNAFIGSKFSEQEVV